MITDTFRVRVSIPMKGGARAEADFLLGDTRVSLTHQQAVDLHKALKTAGAVSDMEMYVAIVKTSVDDGFKPS